MGDCKSLLGPFYCQYIYYEMRQQLFNSSHLFTFYEQEASHIIASNLNVNTLDYREDCLYSIVNFDSSIIDNKFDKENVKIINYTNYFPKYENAQVNSKYAPYDFEIHASNSNELSQIPRYDSFNYCVFCDSISDVLELIDYWKSATKLSGNLYCLYLNPSIEGLNKIVKPVSIHEPRNIQFYDLRSVSLDFVLNVLKNSVFSLHYEHRLIYSFWALRQKCFPVVLKEDVLSKYIKHLDDKTWFPNIVESFWYHRKELAELIKSLDKIVINKFNVASFI